MDIYSIITTKPTGRSQDGKLGAVSGLLLEGPEEKNDLTTNESAPPPPIHSLEPGTLKHIFLETMESQIRPASVPRKHCLYDHKALLKLSSVCQSWREISLAYSELWGQVLEIDTQRYDALKSYLRRSGSSPISLFSTKSVPRSDVESVRIWTMALYHVHHCRHFYFEFQPNPVGGHDARPIDQFMASPAPMLTTLTLFDCTIPMRFPTLSGNPTPSSASMCRNGPCTTTAVFSGHAPMLTNVIIGGFMMRWGKSLSFPSFRGITSLTIEHCAEDIPLTCAHDGPSQCLAVIHNLPNLSILQLVNALYFPEYTSFDGCDQCIPSDTFKPPELSYLKLAGGFKGLCYILDHIKVAANCSYFLDFTVDKFPIMITNTGRFAWNLELIRSPLRQFYRLISHYRHSDLTQWDLTISQGGVRAHLGNDLHSSLFAFRVTPGFMSVEEWDEFLSEILLPFSEHDLPSIRNLSIVLQSPVIGPQSVDVLRGFVSKMPSITQLYISNHAISLLCFAILQRPPSQFDFYQRPQDQYGVAAIFPLLKRLFIESSAVLSLSVWGLLMSYLQWRLERERGVVREIFLVGMNDSCTETLARTLTTAPVALLESNTAFQVVPEVYGNDSGTRRHDNVDLVEWHRERLAFLLDPVFFGLYRVVE